MKNTGNPKVAYGSINVKIEKLMNAFEPNTILAKSLFRASLILPIILWLFGLISSFIGEITDIPYFSFGLSYLDIVLVFTVIYGLLNNKVALSKTFTGLFWLIEFSKLFGTLANYHWSQYIYYISQFIIVIYLLLKAFKPQTDKSRGIARNIRPIMKMMTYVILLINLVLGILLFFVDIKVNYFNFRKLAALVLAFIMIIIISDDFRKALWLKRLKKIAPLVGLLALVLTTVFDSIVSFFVNHGVHPMSGFYFFLNPIYDTLFMLCFILPIYYLSNYDLNLVSGMDSANNEERKVLSTEAAVAQSVASTVAPTPVAVHAPVKPLNENDMDLPYQEYGELNGQAGSEYAPVDEYENNNYQAVDYTNNAYDNSDYVNPQYTKNEYETDEYVDAENYENPLDNQWYENPDLRVPSMLDGTADNDIGYQNNVNEHNDYERPMLHRIDTESPVTDNEQFASVRKPEVNFNDDEDLPKPNIKRV